MNCQSAPKVAWCSRKICGCKLPCEPVSSGSLAMLAAIRRRLVTGEQLARRPAAGLILAIDEGQRLPVGVADDEARGRFPRRTTVAESGGAEALVRVSVRAAYATDRRARRDRAAPCRSHRAGRTVGARDGGVPRRPPRRRSARRRAAGWYRRSAGYRR